MRDERFEGDRRPSPDALLETTRRRGRLKIFLGAAPGVGKTFEMLTAAQAKHREGVDVVVGVVETHGRKETEALLAGLEVIPRRKIEYKGRSIDEMDLDAILARRPQLALVDELAHTNAPESRHPKRYQDVEELLAAGIDVYTTLNIQHVESLNDVVAKITRIRVRETVPDSIIDRADDIEVLDLTPDDLIQRLKEGKVYVPRQAERALRHYFSPGNLTALRELALRRTAQRVDEQMVNYMRSHAIAGPWAAGDRVLVCIGEEPNSKSVVRHGRRMADTMRAPWTAIYVETSRTARLSEAEQDRITNALRLAQRLGAEVVTIPGHDRVEAVLEYARENNFTQIIIAKSRQSSWLGARIRIRNATTDPPGSGCEHPRHRRAGRGPCRPDPGSEERARLSGSARRAGLCGQPALGGHGARRGPGLAHFPGGLQHRPRIPDRDFGGSDWLRAVPIAAGVSPQRPCLQLLFPAAALHLHDRRSGERRRAVLFRRGRFDREQSRGAHARPGRHRSATGEDDGGALPVQSQARRRRDAR